MQLFYYPQPQETDSFLSLEKEDTRHITKVLRKKVGDLIHITNGRGHLFEGELSQLTSNRCVIDLKHINKSSWKHPKLHIAIAPTKMNDRMEWFLEKATELGVQEITPILCSNSERRTIKEDRFDKIIISALQQSLQLHKPILNAFIPYPEFIQQKFDGQKLIAHCEEGNKIELANALPMDENSLIVIGPEGDFTDQEIQSALENGFKPISLGPNRLRTETAGVYATSIYNSQVLSRETKK